MPDNINWSAVFQSIVDTWLPLIGVVATVIAILLIVHFIGKRKK